MPKIAIYEKLRLGEVDVPQAVIEKDKVFEYLDLLDAWPDDELVLDHYYTIINDAEEKESNHGTVSLHSKP